MDTTDNEIFTWWETVGSKQKKSKQGEITEAINYLNASTLCNTLKNVFAEVKAKSEELFTADSEAQKSQAKIEDLQSQLDKLVVDQLALAKKCEKYKDIIANLENKLLLQESNVSQNA